MTIDKIICQDCILTKFDKKFIENLGEWASDREYLSNMNFFRYSSVHKVVCRLCGKVIWERKSKSRPLTTIHEEMRKDAML
jgi:hypothetical protein